jgi:hypothetical protein
MSETPTNCPYCDSTTIYGHSNNSVRFDCWTAMRNDGRTLQQGDVCRLRVELAQARAELAALKAKASATDWINAVTPPSPTRAEVVSDRYLTLDPWGGPVRILTFVHATQEWTENGDDTQRVAWYAHIPGRAALAETKEGQP